MEILYDQNLSSYHLPITLAMESQALPEHSTNEEDFRSINYSKVMWPSLSDTGIDKYCRATENISVCNCLTCCEFATCTNKNHNNLIDTFYKELCEAVVMSSESICDKKMFKITNKPQDGMSM